MANPASGLVAGLGLLVLYKLVQHREISLLSSKSSNPTPSTSCNNCSNPLDPLAPSPAAITTTATTTIESAPTLTATQTSTSIALPPLVKTKSESDREETRAIRTSMGTPCSLTTLATNEFTRVRPLVVCGPSGVGKGTLLSRLLAEFPAHFGKSISHTTRPPRKGEVNGVSYHFVNKFDMEIEISQGKFIESAHVHGNIYGTSISSVSSVCESGKICILEVDVQGAVSVSNTPLTPHCIFILPPSNEVLIQRLKGRGTESEETIKTRLATAEKELNFLESNKSLFQFTVVNNDLETAYSELKQKLTAHYPQLSQTPINTAKL